MTKIEAETAVTVLRGLGYDVSLDETQVDNGYFYCIKTRGVNGSRGRLTSLLEAVLIQCRQNRVARLF